MTGASRHGTVAAFGTSEKGKLWKSMRNYHNGIPNVSFLGERSCDESCMLRDLDAVLHGTRQVSEVLIQN